MELQEQSMEVKHVPKELEQKVAYELEHALEDTQAQFAAAKSDGQDTLAQAWSLQGQKKDTLMTRMQEEIEKVADFSDTERPAGEGAGDDPPGEDYGKDRA